MNGAAAERDRASALARAGRDDEANACFDEAIRRYPRDPGMLNSAGSFHAERGRLAEALALFERALVIDPRHVDAGVNRGIVLLRIGATRDALVWLVSGEAHLKRHPRYWNVRANAELENGNAGAAAAAYDASLRLAPMDAKALQGRALAALNLGASDAVFQHERALAAAPGDPHVALGLAQALEAAGEVDEARQWAEALARQLPQWVPGLDFLAHIRWATGDRDDFDNHFESAASADVALAHVATLIGVDRHAAAARIAAEAAHRWPDRLELTLAQAVASGAAGDLDQATTAFARQPDDLWPCERARHAIRLGEIDRADALLDRALMTSPGDVDAWSLRCVVWRLSGHPAYPWLAEQPGLVREIALELDEETLSATAATLDGLHDRSSHPIGQSVKEGSQTRGSLFARREPPFIVFRDAVERALEQYRSGLAALDSEHPLLRYRDTPWRIVGSWSIRLNGRGHHAAHVHKQGVLSSAAYVAVPQSIDSPDRPGWLEIGRPPGDLNTKLEAVTIVRPKPGHCVLFPSFFFHGTRPIESGRRTTIAFDVAR